jgi:GT2 family glycosyltransferase
MHYLRTEPGLARQRNSGIDAVPNACKFVHFLDDDAEVESEYFACLEAAMVASPEVGGASGIQTTSRPLQLKWLRRLFLLQGPDLPLVLRSGRNSYPWNLSGATCAEWLQGATMSYRREVFDRHMFDGRLEGYSWGEDYDLSYRVSQAWRLYWVPEARAIHHFSPMARARARSLGQARVHVIHAWVREHVHLGLSTRAYWWSVVGEILVLAIKWVGLRDKSFALEAVGTAEGAWQVLRHGSERGRRP